MSGACVHCTSGGNRQSMAPNRAFLVPSMPRDDPASHSPNAGGCCSRGGRWVFTVPAKRHGGPGDLRDDYTVHHEFGADVWIPVLRAGFASCTLHCLEYPAGLAIEARP